MTWLRTLNWRVILGTVIGGVAVASAAIGAGTALATTSATGTEQAVGGAAAGLAAFAAFIRYVIPRLLADADGDGRLAAADTDDTDPERQ
jgi:hypothetical protein